MVRVRFAPSPTGFLHIGGARTALYGYLYAKKNKGVFVLRVEDTDLERSTEEFIKMQMADLKWLGLDWDEGLEPEALKDVGNYGPYRQSQRLDIYKQYADQLLVDGKAYYCFLTDDEIKAQREQAKKEGRPPHVDSPYRSWALGKAQEKLTEAGEATIRFKVPKEKKDYKVNDLVRNEVSFPSDMVGDFVIMRSNGMPVYNFCCTIDDALMKITHVFRAEEHLSNTLRQMMIYEALGFDTPEFAHMSIILGEDRQKLSKRHGATSVTEYKNQGYLPQAVNNFMALLGWSSPKAQEILSMQELTEQFTTDRLNPAAAVFDEAKLKWVNATHLRALPHQELWSLVEPVLKEAGLTISQDQDWQNRALEVFKTSMETLNDVVELFRPVVEFKIYEEAKEVLEWPTSQSVFIKWKELVKKTSSDFLTEDDFSNIQNTIKKECEVKGKQLFMPIRVAIIGKPHGAELKVLVPLIHKKTLLERVESLLS